MSADSNLVFDQPDALTRLAALGEAGCDGLEFGVIGFDAGTVVRLYNATESRAAGLAPGSVLGQPLFTVVAPCMNNFMVAQRFVDAAADGTALDAIINYVLTLRMRPVKVRLRLLASSASAGTALSYLLVERRS